MPRALRTTPFAGAGRPIDNGDRPTGGTAYLAAGNDISVRHLTSGPISYTGIVNADSDNVGGGSVILLTNSFINVEERLGNLRVDDISSSQNDVTIWALGRIIDAEDDAQTTPDPIASFTAATPTTGTDVRGVNITMFAGLAGNVGGVGNAGNYLEIDVDVLNGNGVLNVLDIFAGDTPGIFIAETSGDLEIDTVWTTNDVSMYTIDGDINDARNSGAGDSEVNVLGQTIDLDANDFGGDAASIGSAGNDLEIDSLRGAPTEDVSLEADDSIFVTEADAKVIHSFNVTTAGALDTYDSLEDDPEQHPAPRAGPGVHRRHPHHRPGGSRPARGRRPDPPGERRLPAGRGRTPPGRQWHDHRPPGFRAPQGRRRREPAPEQPGPRRRVDRHLRRLVRSRPDRGRTRSELRNRHAPAGPHRRRLHQHPATSAVQSSPATPIWTTEIWGFTDVDTFQFGDATGLPTLATPKETLGDDGYIYLGSKTRVYGDETTNPTGNDGEDQFLVYYLQSTLVTTSPSTGTGSIATAGHSLTLDGLADTDTYNIWTTGSRGVPRNYLINILDTGAENDGVDEAFVHGFDSDVNGDDTPNNPPPSDDIFLLRRVTCIDTETQDGLGPIVDGSAGCVSPTELGVDRPGFVAMLHGNVDDFRFNGPGDTDTGQNTNVQRVNYDSGLNGRLTVLGYGGNDHFYSDDTSVAITLDGGEGNDVFQIGQQFGTKRSAAGISVPGEPTDGGALLPQDTFPDLIATTRGWLSPGISAPMVVHGGTGEDRFTVYSNQAELRLEGDDNNDLFVIRAFALAAVCDRMQLATGSARSPTSIWTPTRSRVRTRSTSTTTASAPVRR